MTRRRAACRSHRVAAARPRIPAPPGRAVPGRAGPGRAGSEGDSDDLIVVEGGEDEGAVLEADLPLSALSLSFLSPSPSLSLSPFSLSLSLCPSLPPLPPNVSPLFRSCDVRSCVCV